MTIKLYKTKSPDNSLIKAFAKEEIFNNCTLKQLTDIENPSIMLKYNGLLFDYNYLYLSDINKYYFVRNFKVTPTNIYTLDCEIDVLMTYGEQLKDMVVLTDTKILFSNNFNQEGVNVLLGVTNL